MSEKRVADVTPVSHPAFDGLVATIEALRAPDGCPWDREQTHRSIAHNMIEEAYEAVDAIESDSVAHLREELGDVLLQVVLQSQIAADAGEFDIDDVCRAIDEKMIRRHPHVFGDATAENANDVTGLWEQVKLAEKESADAEAASAGVEIPEGLFDGVPTSFPALMQAQKISRKAAAAGFEWDTVDDVWEKVAEEVAGAWIGGTIDTTSGVVASSEMIGEAANRQAVIIKAAQNVLIGVVAFFIALYLSTRGEKGGQAPSLGIVWEKFPKFILGFVAASLVFSLCQSNGLFTLGAKGKLLEPGVAKMFSTVFFSLAFVCIGLDTRLKDIVSKENRNVLRSFLVAQTFNIVVTFVIACLLFGLLKPAL